MREIKIYGDIVGVADSAENNICLIDVQKMLNEANGEPITVRLNGDGGDVHEGFAIYYELRRYAQKNDVKIKTFAESRLNSIYTVIFLAGDERELCTDLEPFVHKAYVPGNVKLSEKEQIELNAINNRIAQHYADHTELTIDEALELMENETYIPTETAKAMRFATSIEQVLRPAALERFNNKQKDDMNKNPKTNSIVAKAMALLNSLKSVQNKMVTTADQTEVDFYELGEDDVIEVGAKARVNGEDATGTHVMSDGRTFVFDAGTLIEIVEADTEDEVAKLQAVVDSLTGQLEEVTNKAKEAIEAKEATIATLNAKVLTYQNARSAAPETDTKQKPVDTKVETKVNRVAAAIENLKKTNKK